MKLYDYYRSSASYRVRIAIHYKELDCEFEQIQLAESEQYGADFSDKNPQQLVPLLEDDGLVLNQSMAILEYLEEKSPAKPLLPANIINRAQVRAFAAEIACDMHPLNNLRVLKYLVNTLETDEEKKMNWYFEWLERGFTSLEKRVTATKGSFCFGYTPTWADLFLIPQMYNAFRFSFPMEKFPQLVSVYDYCLTQPYFIKASPESRLKEIEDR